LTELQRESYRRTAVKFGRSDDTGCFRNKVR